MPLALSQHCVSNFVLSKLITLYMYGMELVFKFINRNLINTQYLEMQYVHMLVTNNSH